MNKVERMKFQKGDLFTGCNELNLGVILLALEDTRAEGYDQTLCQFLNHPEEPEKVGTTTFFADWALANYYRKVVA